jgi:hypothetical protein
VLFDDRHARWVPCNRFQRLEQLGQSEPGVVGCAGERCEHRRSDDRRALESGRWHKR